MLGLRAIGQGAGGVEKAVGELSALLADRGHDVTAFCRTRYNPSGLSAHPGVHLVNLPAIYTKHLEAISHTFLAVWRTLRGFDIVHFHATGPSLLAFIPRLAGRKVVVTVHGLDWKREKWRGFAKAVLRIGAWTAVHFPHRTVVVSRCLEDFYRERYGRDTVHIPNGVDIPERRPVNRIRRFGVSGGDYVLYLGRLVPEKGCHLLIEAFRKLDTRHKLLIVGDASHSDDYVAQLRSAAAGDDRIIFTGGLYDEDKDEAYSNAACFVLPSTLEGMPIVLLEAMSHGCPVLCSDIPENLEIVRPESGNESYGLVFTSGSASELREQLAAMLDQPGAARQRAARAQSYVQSAFSWSAIADETATLYRSLLATPRLSLPHRVSAYNRRRKWELFLRTVQPTPQTRILDVGFAEQEHSASDNYIEKHHAWPANITALGVVEPVSFSQRYPEVKAVRYDGSRFPFEDKAFDVCWSNAVLEHVGGRDRQVLFLQEVNRVAQLAFITTPNRHFPVEVHTRIPLLHWLPKRYFDRFLRWIGKDWAAGDYMHLLSSRRLRQLLRDAGIGPFVIIPNRLLGLCTVDFVILFGARLEHVLSRTAHIRRSS